jgi:hypothetical protein
LQWLLELLDRQLLRLRDRLTGLSRLRLAGLLGGLGRGGGRLRRGRTDAEALAGNRERRREETGSERGAPTATALAPTDCSLRRVSVEQR